PPYEHLSLHDALPIFGLCAFAPARGGRGSRVVYPSKLSWAPDGGARIPNLATSFPEISPLPGPLFDRAQVRLAVADDDLRLESRSEEHTSELQSPDHP